MAKFRIKTIVAAKGMTLKSLAEKLEVTPQFLSGIVNEKNNPNLTTLEKIAEALEVPVSSLFADYLSPNHSVLICPHCGGRVEIATGNPK